MTDYQELPKDLPAPTDDGAADHLEGSPVPSIDLPEAHGGEFNLLTSSCQETVVTYVYPMTGTPGRPLPDGWDEVPGARGCTPQSCAFRDHQQEFADLGASVFGLSGQSIDEQREFAEREHIPYPLLNDSSFVLSSAFGLPTFELDGARYYRRLTFVAREGSVVKVFYPVFPPQLNAYEVISWLRSHATP